MVYLRDRSDEHLLRDYVAWRVRNRDWRPETVRVRGSQVRRLGEFFADRGVRLATASHDDYAAYVAHIEDSYRYRTGRRMSNDAVASLIAMCNGLNAYLIDWLEIRQDDPTRKLRRPKIHRRQPRPMPEHDVRRSLIIASADDTLFAQLALVYCNGLRVSDLASVGRHDVTIFDDGTGELYIREGKGGEDRIAPLATGVVDVLRPLLRGGDTGPLFPDRHGRYYSANNLGRRINVFLAEEVGTKFRIHSGRHAFATGLYGFDPNVFRLATLMGHKSVEDTARYTQTNPRDALPGLTDLAEKRLGGVRRRGPRGATAAVVLALAGLLGVGLSVEPRTDHVTVWEAS